MRKDPAIIMMALGQILVWAGLYYVFPALLLKWEQSLGWSKTDLTAAITLAVFMSAFASPIVGKMIDSGKGPQLMTGSACLGGMCLFGVSMITELWQFYLGWGLIGIALAGCLYEPCFALVTRCRGAKAKQSIILITLIAGFAGAISFPMAHTLTEIWGWRSTLQVFAAVVIFGATPLLWRGASLLERTGTHSTLKPTRKGFLSQPFMVSPVFWLLGIGFALAALLHGVALHHLLPILADRGIHQDVAVVAAAFIGPMQVAGRLAMMAAERHISNNAIAVSCFLVMACSILLLIGAGTTPALLVGFVILFGGGYGVVSIIRPVIARDILGQENFGAKSGALALLYLTGTASAPYLGSLVWNVGGYQLVLPCLLLLALFGLGLYMLASKFSAKQGAGVNDT
ncbi:MAG: MFS transporter [bacterium]